MEIMNLKSIFFHFYFYQSIYIYNLYPHVAHNIYLVLVIFDI